VFSDDDLITWESAEAIIEENHNLKAFIEQKLMTVEWIEFKKSKVVCTANQS
jgi:hypothetical protein